MLRAFRPLARSPMASGQCAGCAQRRYGGEGARELEPLAGYRRDQVSSSVWESLNFREGVSMKLVKHHQCLRGVQLVLPILVLCFWANAARVDGQQLRDVFRSVQPAVVIVKTEQVGLAPFPQQGLVSSDGLGSGVLISSDKVLTAAHVVQSADRTVVEFSQGESIRAQVIGVSSSADVALLQLERSPANYVAAKLGDSDQVAVGDEIFVVGAPYGISDTLTAGHVSARRPLKDKSQ